jgi:WD40 repeat protein
VCWSHDGSKVVSGSYDESMKIWDASTGDCLHSIQAGLEIDHLAWSADGSKVASSTDGWIMIYNAQTYELLTKFKLGDRLMHPIDFSPDGDRVVDGSGNSVFIRDLTRNTVVSRFDGHSNEVKHVVYSPSGTSVISADKTLVKIWALNGERTAPGHEPDTSKPFDAASFSPNGQLLATATDDELEVNLFDASTFSHIHTLFLDEKARYRDRCLAFSSDSTLIACGCYDMIRIWNVDTGDVVSNIYSRSYFDHLCFSPDGERIATWGDKYMQLWDVRQGELIAKYISENGQEVTFLKMALGYSSHPSPNQRSCWTLSLRLARQTSRSNLCDHPSKSLLCNVSLHRTCSRNRRLFWIPPDRRPDSWYHQSTATHGQQVVWCSSKGRVVVDFSDVSMDADTYAVIH